LATATPIQLYEKVSEAEALSRNDHLNGQMIYQVSQEEALRRSARYEHCQKICLAKICATYCTFGRP